MSNEPFHEADTDEARPDESLSRVIWAGLFFAVAIFAAFPGLDLLVSARYYRAGEGFVHAHDPLVRALYNWTPWLGRALVVGLLFYALLAPLIARWLARRGQAAAAERARGPWRHWAIVSICCALLGPGLVVEGVLKNVVGRPRPVQVVPFGGPDAYQAPFVRGADPSSHRSFVSSHAAAGFALISLGLTCSPTWRRRWLLIGIVTGGVVGMGRMLQGGHFLSDIVFAFYAVWLSCELVAWVDRRRMARRTSTLPSARRARRRT
jgi:lipid A 4'-phosphatase